MPNDVADWSIEISGNVVASGAVDANVTNAAVPVSAPSALPVSGTVGVSGTVPVSGSVDANVTNANVPVSAPSALPVNQQYTVPTFIAAVHGANVTPLTLTLPNPAVTGDALLLLAGPDLLTTPPAGWTHVGRGIYFDVYALTAAGGEQAITIGDTSRTYWGAILAQYRHATPASQLISTGITQVITPTIAPWMYLYATITETGSLSPAATPPTGFRVRDTMQTGGPNYTTITLMDALQALLQNVSAATPSSVTEVYVQQL